MYLKERTLQIKIDTSYSKTFKMQQGLPQGSPLSPLLYNIYCHDIYNQENDLAHFNPNLYILQYADDTVESPLSPLLYNIYCGDIYHHDFS